MYEITCPNCETKFQTKDKRAKFCSRSCSASYTNKGKTLSEDAKQNISEGLKKHFANNPDKIKSGDELSKIVGESTRGRFRKEAPESIMTLNHRTVGKILRRMKLSCSRCGWNEATGDIHHINGRKIFDCDNHDNLCYLCPNCHRLAHSKLVDKNTLIPLSIYFGEKWKEYYYG